MLHTVEKHEASQYRAKPNDFGETRSAMGGKLDT